MGRSDQANDEARAEALEALRDGSAWDAFCDQLKVAGKIVLDESVPDNDIDRVEGYRYLARLTRCALESYLESADNRAPEFRRPVHETIKMGMDNPDNVYLSAPVDSRYRYRVSGTRGTVHYLGFGTQSGGYGKTGNLETTGYLEAADMTLEADGRFSIIVSAERPNDADNWLPMAPDSRMIQVRQTRLDHSQEVIAQVAIERIDEQGQSISKPRPFLPERLAPALQSAGKFVQGTAHVFKSWTDGFKAHSNTLPRFSPDVAFKAGGDPNIAYYHSYFDIKDDEALEITLNPPECDFWNFQLGNYWLESLEYRYFPVHINNHTARYEADGSVVVTVSKYKPDTEVANWLDTCGRNQGTMCVRWIRAKAEDTDLPVPRVKIITIGNR